MKEDKILATVFILMGIAGLAVLYNIIANKRYYTTGGSYSYSKTHVVVGNIILALFTLMLLGAGFAGVGYFVSKK